MSRGLAYDSDEGRNYAAALTAIMHGEAYKQSSRSIARDHGGPFAELRREPRAVPAGHRQAPRRRLPHPDQRRPEGHARGSATVVFDEALELGEQHGYRNAQVTVLAPTGTIAFMMDCDTTGVEPDIALIKYKKLVGEGFLKIVNQTVPAALRKLGYGAEEVDEILAYLTEHETIEGAPHLKPQHLPVFDCAFKPANGERSIHYMGHVRMMGAIQPFISRRDQQDRQHARGRHGRGDREGLPRGLEARPQGDRGLPRQLEAQPAAVDRQEDRRRGRRRHRLRRGREAAQAARQGPGRGGLPHRRRLPAERSAVTHKFDIAGHEGYITVGLYPDGQPGEIFLKMAKEGSTVSGLMDTLRDDVSVALQYGVPLKDLVNKFAHVRFEPSGFTGNQEIPIAKSIVDYIFRWLGSRFLSPEDKANLGLIDRTAVVADAPASSPGLRHGRLGRRRPPRPSPTPRRRRRPPAGVEPPPSHRPDAPKATAVAAEPSPQPAARAPGRHRHQRRRSANGHAAQRQRQDHERQRRRLDAPITLNLGATKVSFQTQADAPSCMDCGSIMVRNGSCYKCLNCGSTSGCS